MRILVLDASPKKVSDTMRATSMFVKGIEDLNQGDVIEVVKLINCEIKPCLGCFQCWKNMDGKCIQEDDQNTLLEKYVKADIIIFSFPLYCYSMPSTLKAFFDRTIPLVKKSMSIENEGVRHDSLVDFSKKRSVVLCGCGFPQFEDNFTGLKCQLNMILHRYVGVFYSEAPLLNIKEAEAVADPLLEKFYEAGREFRDRLWLSEKTIQDLEAPMIPMEKYVSYVNS